MREQWRMQLLCCCTFTAPPRNQNEFRTEFPIECILRSNLFGWKIQFRVQAHTYHGMNVCVCRLVRLPAAAFGPRIAFTFSVSLIYLFASNGTRWRFYSISSIWKNSKCTHTCARCIMVRRRARAFNLSYPETCVPFRNSIFVKFIFFIEFNFVRFRALACTHTQLATAINDTVRIGDVETANIAARSN